MGFVKGAEAVVLSDLRPPCYKGRHCECGYVQDFEELNQGAVDAMDFTALVARCACYRQDPDRHLDPRQDEGKMVDMVKDSGEEAVHGWAEELHVEPNDLYWMFLEAVIKAHRTIDGFTLSDIALGPLARLLSDATMDYFGRPDRETGK